MARLVSCLKNMTFLNLADLSPEAQFAYQVVLNMCPLALKAQAMLPSLWQEKKVDGSIVTAADFAVEACLIREVRTRFPKHSVVAEERASSLLGKVAAIVATTDLVRHRFPDVSETDVLGLISQNESQSSNQYWLLDPIDSTRNFAKGRGFSINFSFVLGGMLQVGVSAFPRLSLDQNVTSGLVFLAIRGAGSWMAPLSDPSSLQRLHVSERRVLGEAIPLRGPQNPHSDQTTADANLIQGVYQFLGPTQPALRGPVIERYPKLVAGLGDFFFNFILPNDPNSKLCAWDHAVGALLVEEAGGRVTDLRGDSLDFSQGAVLSNNHGLLVSNGWLHGALLAGWEAMMTA